ncbi:hypothetical protein [Xanthomonas bundabergensis]|uniref:hypothetical protein n=1 Tax=Xanthomonas bundabergensis TaxID=3160842 RepID=UPI0035195477
MGYTIEDVQGWIGEATLTEWKQLTPTNIPKPHGGYTYTDKDAQATNTSGSAAAWIEGKLKALDTTAKEFGGAQKIGGFWIKLGAITKKTKIGRCLHMSGVAAVDLLSNANFDNVKISIVGSTAYDHHFVVLDIFNATDRAWQRFIVDIWQGRVDQSNTFVYTDATHPYYRRGELATFFEFDYGAGKRKIDTALIAEAKAVN